MAVYNEQLYIKIALRLIMFVCNVIFPKKNMHINLQESKSEHEIESVGSNWWIA